MNATYFLMTPYIMYLETRGNTLYIGGTSMRALDRVIGYESIKVELYRIISMRALKILRLKS